MANLYVRSTDGNDADNGSSWALADATITGADAAPDAAGDTIWLSQVHAESTAGNINVDFAGTEASPTKLLCGNDAAEPPTTLATTATISTSGGAYGVAISGCVYGYGISLISASGGVNSTITLGSGVQDVQTWESCYFKCQGNGTGARLILGSASNQNASQLKFINCDFSINNTTVNAYVTNAHVEWNGGSFVAQSNLPTDLIHFYSTSEGAAVFFNSFDFSALGSTFNLVDTGSVQSGVFRVTNSKLPSSWSGGLYNGTPIGGMTYELINCSAGTTEFYYWYEDLYGEIRDDTGIYITSGYSKTSYGGADVPYSLKLSPSSNANRFFTLRTPWVPVWVSSTGSKTLSIEVAYDSATTLKDYELPLFVSYAGSSGSLYHTIARETTAGEQLIGSGTTLTDTSAAWTGAGGWTNKKTHTLSISVTVNEVGYVYLAVGVGVTTHTVYVNRLVTVS